MSFWSYNVASPKLWHTLGFWKPHYLRERPASVPYTPQGLTAYHRLNRADTQMVCDLWTKHYGGEDWYLDANPAWVQSYLDDPSVIVLGVFTIRENALVGTIVSTPFSGGATRFHQTQDISDVRVIEGLCIHSRFRKLGIAGYLIYAMDYETSKRPTIHFWSRETPAPPLLSTALVIQTYAFVQCKDIVCMESCLPIPWPEMVLLWSTLRSPGIVARVPVNRGGLEAWEVNGTIMVVSDTKRKTKRTREPIWEVIWTGQIRGEELVSGPIPLRYLESLAAKKTGILFVTKSNTDDAFTPPWQFGTSGVQSWYIYNFCPDFRNGQLEALREEI